MSGSARHTERGQILVIVAGGMLAIVAMVGLVVDVGYAWGQQRESQNGADAAAHAGAIVLLDRYAGGQPGLTESQWDSQVHQAIQLSAIQNGITVPEAQYTNWQGTPYDPPVVVGPTGGTNVPADAQGVEVIGRKTFAPFIAQIIGFTSFTANTGATAVAGNIPGPCEVENCILLPIAFPSTMLTCTATGNSSEYAYDPITGEPVPWPDNTAVIMPLCGGNPGSVGWVDWTPQVTTDGCTGTGTAEIICHVEDPPVQDIAQPSWQEITATGGPSSQDLENALNEYAGQIVLLPLFDSTCDTKPTNPELDGCPPANVGGNGNNQWYHVPKPGFAAFRFDYPKGAYTNGDYSVPCGTVNAKQCLVGTFVKYVSSGAVGAPDPDSRDFGVQLIR
ncbi:hypothetical protein BH23CHL9_BH23CHL9_04060 [soil metagenome]